MKNHIYVLVLYSLLSAVQLVHGEASVSERGDWLVFRSFDNKFRDYEAPMIQKADTVRVLRKSTIVFVEASIDRSVGFEGPVDNDPEEWPGSVSITADEKVHVIRGINFAEAKKLTEKIISILGGAQKEVRD